MKVHLNIQEDAAFREYVRDLIAGQVRGILREQLSGIIAGEIAKLKLLQPDSPMLSELVTKQVNAALYAAGGRMKDHINAEILKVAKEQVAPMKEQIAAMVKKELVAAITALK